MQAPWPADFGASVWESASRDACSSSAPRDGNATLPLYRVAAEALAGYCLPLRALASTSRSAAW